MTAPRRWVPFAYGFRPFFLLAGISAVVGIGAWLWVYRNGVMPLPGLPPQAWHGHEMLFGFAAAAIAGFMLTAVPSWTSSRGFAGPPLVLLTLLWLAGRAAFLAADYLPTGVIWVAELAFLPALMLVIAPALLRSVTRNTPLLVVLATLWAADIAFLVGLARGDAALASAALRGALGIVLVLISVIGGRIVPAFTANALRSSGLDVHMRSSVAANRLAIGFTLAYAASDTVAPLSAATGVIAALAAGAHAWRLAGWQGLKTVRMPIVWVLHAGYVWLPAGLALKALHVLGGVSWAAHGLHALGAGAAGTMIMAVMTRAALGHTGRPLVVTSLVAWAYLGLTLSVLVRVFGTVLVPQAYAALVMIASALWMSAFGAFLFVYAPILLQERVDGRPG